MTAFHNKNNDTIRLIPQAIGTTLLRVVIGGVQKDIAIEVNDVPLYVPVSSIEVLDNGTDVSFLEMSRPKILDVVLHPSNTTQNNISVSVSSPSVVGVVFNPDNNTIELTPLLKGKTNLTVFAGDISKTISIDSVDIKVDGFEITKNDIPLVTDSIGASTTYGLNY